MVWCSFHLVLLRKSKLPEKVVGDIGKSKLGTKLMDGKYKEGKRKEEKVEGKRKAKLKFQRCPCRAKQARREGWINPACEQMPHSILRQHQGCPAWAERKKNRVEVGCQLWDSWDSNNEPELFLLKESFSNGSGKHVSTWSHPISNAAERTNPVQSSLVLVPWHSTVWIGHASLEVTTGKMD